MTNDEKKNMMEKIKKLLTLSKNDGATEAEAESAARHARKLLDKHNLTMGDIEVEEVGKFDFEITTAKLPTWQVYMLSSVTEAYDCGWYRQKGFKRDQILIVGAEADVLVVQYYLRYVKDVIYRMSKEFSSMKIYKEKTASGEIKYDNCKKWQQEVKPGYMVGMAQTISQRLKSMNADRMKTMAKEEGVTGMTGTEIILVKTNAVSKKLEEIGVKSSARRGGAMNRNSLNAGRAAGNKVNLHKGVTESRSCPKQLA